MRSATSWMGGLLLSALTATAFAGDATGKWSGTVKLPNGQELAFVAHLKQQGAQVTGTLDGINGGPSVTITDGKNEKDSIGFSAVRKINGEDVKFNYTGKLDAEALDLTITRADGKGAPLQTHT